jgi:hypothetical protein
MGTPAHRFGLKKLGTASIARCHAGRWSHSTGSMRIGETPARGIAGEDEILEQHKTPRSTSAPGSGRAGALASMDISAWTSR